MSNMRNQNISDEWSASKIGLKCTVGCSGKRLTRLFKKSFAEIVKWNEYPQFFTQRSNNYPSNRSKLWYK